MTGLIGTAAYYGQAIIETPSNGCCPVPTFSTAIGMDGATLCPGTALSSCVWYSNANVQTSYDQMHNYCTSLGTYIYNINVGATINNVGAFTETYNNNCDF